MWEDTLKDIIFKSWKVGQTFTLKDIYSHKNKFNLIFTDNNNIEAKLRQTLQVLRDKGILEFIR